MRRTLRISKLTTKLKAKYIYNGAINHSNNNMNATVTVWNNSKNNNHGVIQLKLFYSSVDSSTTTTVQQGKGGTEEKSKGILSRLKKRKSEEPSEEEDGSRKTLIVAFVANLTITASKLGAFIFSGSSSMLSEAVHSFIDSINLFFLSRAISSSSSPPDASHPYGYYDLRPFWSLISATSLLFISSFFILYHGVSSLFYPSEDSLLLLSSPYHLILPLSILGISFAADLSSFLVARSSLIKKASTNPNITSLATEMSNGLFVFRRNFWKLLFGKSEDPVRCAIISEDVVGMAGCVVAAVSLLLVNFTGLIVFDSIGSILIGSMLAGVGIGLISSNKIRLLDKGVTAQEQQKLVHVIESDEKVKAVFDVKVEEVGPGIMRFKAEVEFEGRKMAEEALKEEGMKEMVEECVKKISSRENEEQGTGAGVKEIEKMLIAFGDRMVQKMGKEVDRLEEELQRENEHVEHIDLEVHWAHHADDNASEKKNSDTTTSDKQTEKK